jgi:hypothetical protein
MSKGKSFAEIHNQTRGVDMVLNDGTSPDETMHLLVRAMGHLVGICRHDWGNQGLSFSSTIREDVNGRVFRIHATPRASAAQARKLAREISRL